jgi:hypothetical protein
VFLNKDICLQILKQNATFQKQICFFPQCGLFDAPDSTQPIKHKQWGKYSAMFKYSGVQFPSLSCFLIYLSSFYSSNLEWKFRSSISEFLLNGKLLGHHPCLGVDGWWPVWVLHYLNPECRTDLLCFIRVIIYSAEHGMDVGSEIISNRESLLHVSITQWCNELGR